jgi:glycosyltransferase involved in cell wall biosynthesis
MPHLPRITIVTPSFNQGEFITETIDSIVSQGYPNLEYFVIDGGSTDESVAIIRSFADKITSWISEPDHGQTDAINKGFKRATGDLLCWVNSDDVLLPGCLAAVAEAYGSNGEPDLIHANAVYIDADGHVVRAVATPRQSRYFMERGIWYATAPAIFFSHRLVRQVGYLDPQFRLSMDVDLWLRMVMADGKIVHIPQYLGGFRWHNTSKTMESIQQRGGRGQENPETIALYDSRLTGSTQQSRRRWRLVWKVWRMLRLDYLKAYVDTRTMRGYPWQSIFGGMQAQ